MTFNSDELHIMNRLVGPMDENTAGLIKEKIDCFLHPQVSLFIPASGQCRYAITPSHTHPAYSFIYYFQSVSELIVEGKSVTYDISAGKCLSVMSPDIPHQEPEQEGFQSYIAVMIDAELFRETMRQYVQAVPVFRGEAFVPHPELLGLLKCFMLEAGAYEQKNQDYMNHLAMAVTHLAVRSVICENSRTVPLYDRFEVDRAVAYMNSHFSEKISTEDLAAAVNLSAGYFTKVFKSITGETPIDFLNGMRLQKARNMLIYHTDNITEIALKCGFNTSSYFSFCFLEKYRMTPSAYRLKFQQNHEDRSSAEF